MAQHRWHRLREQDAVTVARRLPVRFDVEVQVQIATQKAVSLTAVAHQVRQDMWRRLQGLRGFSPVVRVGVQDGALDITAGGRIEGGRVSQATQDVLRQLLESPVHQARWLAHAGRRHDA